MYTSPPSEYQRGASACSPWICAHRASGAPRAADAQEHAEVHRRPRRPALATVCRRLSGIFIALARICAARAAGLQSDTGGRRQRRREHHQASLTLKPHTAARLRWPRLTPTPPPTHRPAARTHACRSGRATRAPWRWPSRPRAPAAAAHAHASGRAGLSRGGASERSAAGLASPPPRCAVAARTAPVLRLPPHPLGKCADQPLLPAHATDGAHTHDAARAAFRVHRGGRAVRDGEGGSIRAPPPAGGPRPGRGAGRPLSSIPPLRRPGPAVRAAAGPPRARARAAPARAPQRWARGAPATSAGASERGRACCLLSRRGGALAAVPRRVGAAPRRGGEAARCVCHGDAAGGRRGVALARAVAPHAAGLGALDRAQHHAAVARVDGGVALDMAHVDAAARDRAEEVQLEHAVAEAHAKAIDENARQGQQQGGLASGHADVAAAAAEASGGSSALEGVRRVVGASLRPDAKWVPDFYDPFAHAPDCSPKRSVGSLQVEPQWTVPVVEGAEWPPPDQCDKYNLQDLCDVLRTTARNREVLLAVANSPRARPGYLLEVHQGCRVRARRSREPLPRP